MQHSHRPSNSISRLKLERQRLLSKLDQFSESARKTRSFSTISNCIDTISTQLSELESKDSSYKMYTTPPPDKTKGSEETQTGLSLLPAPIRSAVSNKMVKNNPSLKKLELPRGPTIDDGTGATSSSVPLSNTINPTKPPNQAKTIDSQMNKSLTLEEKMRAFYDQQILEMRREFDDRLSKHEQQIKFYKNAAEKRTANPPLYTGTIPKTNLVNTEPNDRSESSESYYLEISPKKTQLEKSFNFDNLSGNDRNTETIGRRAFSGNQPSAPPNFNTSRETLLNDFSRAHNREPNRNNIQSQTPLQNLPQNTPNQVFPNNFQQIPPGNYFNQFPFMYNPCMNPIMPYQFYPPVNNYPQQSNFTRNNNENPNNRVNHQEPQVRRTFLKYLDSIPIFSGRSHEDLKAFIEVCDRIENICDNQSEYRDFLTRARFQLRGRAYMISSNLNDWVDIRSSILSNYEYLANHDILDSQIENLRQEKDENLEKFTNRAMNLFVKKDEMYCSLSGEQKRDHDRIARKAFARGLFNQTLRETICRQRFSSLEDTISHSFLVEDELRNSSRRETGCTYCKRIGHRESECRSKANNSNSLDKLAEALKGLTTNSNSNNSNFNSNRNNNFNNNNSRSFNSNSNPKWNNNGNKPYNQNQNSGNYSNNNRNFSNNNNNSRNYGNNSGNNNNNSTNRNNNSGGYNNNNQHGGNHNTNQWGNPNNSNRPYQNNNGNNRGNYYIGNDSEPSMENSENYQG